MQQRPSRYAIRRPVEFYMRTPRGPLRGSGHTVNISKTGILFQSESQVIIGKRIELLVNMDEGVDPETAVTLFIQGVTVRHEGSSTAVAIRKQRLKTIPKTEAQLH